MDWLKFGQFVSLIAANESSTNSEFDYLALKLDSVADLCAIDRHGQDFFFTFGWSFV